MTIKTKRTINAIVFALIWAAIEIAVLTLWHANDCETSSLILAFVWHLVAIGCIWFAVDDYIKTPKWWL